MEGGSYLDSPLANPAAGSSCDVGGENLNGFPEEVVIVSVRGLNEREPPKAMAVTISGEARKFMVLGFPSLREAKLRLNEERIVLVCLVDDGRSVLFHCYRAIKC